MTAPVKQMRGCIWYLDSYTDQLSLPREGSDGKEPPQLPAEIRTAEKPDRTPHLSHSPPACAVRQAKCYGVSASFGIGPFLV